MPHAAIAHESVALGLGSVRPMRHVPEFHEFVVGCHPFAFGLNPGCDIGAEPGPLDEAPLLYLMAKGKGFQSGEGSRSLLGFEESVSRGGDRRSRRRERSSANRA